MKISSVNSTNSTNRISQNRTMCSRVIFNGADKEGLKRAFSSLSLKEKIALGGAVLTVAPYVASKLAIDEAVEAKQKLDIKLAEQEQKIKDKVEHYIDKKVKGWIDKYL